MGGELARLRTLWCCGRALEVRACRRRLRSMNHRASVVTPIACVALIGLACSHSPAPPGSTPSDLSSASPPGATDMAPVSSSGASPSGAGSAGATAAAGDVTLPPSSASAWNNAQSDGKAPTTDRNIADYQAIIQNNRDRFRTCYEASLAAHPGIKGRAMLRFVLAPNGTVKEAGLERSNSDITEDDLDRCMGEAVRKLSFPPSKKGMETTVRYPFHFNPKSSK